MVFINHVCWKTERLIDVMNTEALQVSEEIFLATHHPVLMTKVKGHITALQLTEEQFCREFLADYEDHTQAAVKGMAGAGKSHLVRWLYLNLPPSPNRRVILIPKVGTNLRRVLELILEGMEGDVFDQFRTRLNKATEHMSLEQAKINLLDQLALAVGAHGPKVAAQVAEDERDVHTYLIKQLPILLHEPALREHLLATNGIIERLAKLVIGDTERERLEKRRELTLEDLNFEEWDITTSELSRQAQGPFQLLRNNWEHQREYAVKWLNANLDWAIPRLLNLQGDDLLQLMCQVREALGRQDKEMVLLIEDFAKLQGIDYQLLEALIVRPNQDGRRLCRLRTVMAMTSGYYDNLPNTVKDRMNLVMNLDINLQATQAEKLPEYIAEFSSRYLNAVRISDGDAWHSAESRADAGGQEVQPNHCQRCDYQTECHNSFGHVHGVGLYPFNSQALVEMYRRAEHNDHLTTPDHSSSFNPRRLINDVLRDPLSLFAGTLENGDFPPITLLGRFGNQKMRNLMKEQLAPRVKDHRRESQYQTLIELWGNPSDLDSVSSEIMAAFGLTPLLGYKPKPPTSPPLVPPVGEQTVQAPTPVAKGQLAVNLDELDAWGNGGIMRQNMVRILRAQLFPAVDSFIDWDSEMLLRPNFVGQSKLFRSASIVFENQQTDTNTLLRVEVPRTRETVLALQGLLRFVEHGDWTFEFGQRHFYYFTILLRTLAREVVAQIRQLPIEKSFFDPVPSAVELLALGGLLVGKPMADKRDSVEQWVASLFLDWEKVEIGADQERSEEWNRLVRSFAERVPKVREILLSRIACTKGGATGVQIIDVAQVMPALTKFRRDCRLGSPISADINIRDDYQPLAVLRRSIDQLMPAGMSKEYYRFTSWRDQMRKAFPADATGKDVVTLVKTVAKLAKEIGVFGLNNTEAFDSAVNSFSTSRFDEYFRVITDQLERLADHQLLLLFGRGDLARPMNAGSLFVQLTEQLIAKTSRRIEQERSMIAEEEELGQVLQQLGDLLIQMVETMSALTGGVPDAL